MKNAPGCRSRYVQAAAHYLSTLRKGLTGAYAHQPSAFGSIAGLVKIFAILIDSNDYTWLATDSGSHPFRVASAAAQAAHGAAAGGLIGIARRPPQRSRTTRGKPQGGRPTS